MAHYALGTRSRFYIPKLKDNSNTDDDASLHSMVRNAHLRWINGMDRENIADHLMSPAPGRPGYKLVQGKDSDETKVICESLGLNDALVDTAKNRITNGGHILAVLPLAEYKLRRKELLIRHEARTKGFRESHKAAMDGIPGVKGVSMQQGEFMERKEHADRPGKPFVSVSKWDIDAKTA